MQERKPMITVFAGPNGSGKSTIKRLVKTDCVYINADEIKRSTDCTDIEAAQKAESLREKCLAEKVDFSFETVLSTDRNLKLLKRAKDAGYFIKCFYILTSDPEVNLSRIKMRFSKGGHDVPEDKVFSRYNKSLDLLKEVIAVSDVLHIYDNTTKPFRIFKKRIDQFFCWENTYWTKAKIEKLTGVKKWDEKASS